MSSDLSALARRIETAVAAAAAQPVRVREVVPMAGGACQENFRVDLTVGESDLRMVLRSDAKRSLPQSLSRRAEFEVIRTAVARGVKTPPVRWLVPDLLRPGADAYFMDFIEGEAIGRRVLKNPELQSAREKLPAALAEVLARIHGVTPQDPPALPIPAHGAEGGHSPARAQLGLLSAQLDQLPEPRPVIELAARWLFDHAPSSPALTLVHGDFRTGNFMLTPDGLAGVLDWEFAHYGDPLEDIAWLCVRDWRFGRLDKPAGGLATREAFWGAYERASGRTIDRERVHWWEVMGNARWAVGSLYQGERYLSGEERDIELLAVARRAAEMEFEALRLIENGP